MRTDVPTIREHLESPQFPDEDPPSAEDLAKRGFSIARFTGGWAAAGAPRWKAYVISVSSIIVGAFLAIPGPDDIAFLGILGLGLVAFGVFVAAETLRGKRFPRP